jgi:hypothetical protein
MEQSIAIVGMNPHPALASLNEVVVGLVARLKGLHVIAQVDEQLIFVHPIGEVGELLNHLFLQFVDRFHFLLSIMGIIPDFPGIPEKLI